MTLGSLVPALAFVSLGLAAVAAGLDLYQVETHTLVVYTTPALKDFLEKEAIPEFRRETGMDVVTVYMSAAEEYYRLRLSSDRPEADLFVHASPLFMEKGYLEGVIVPFEAQHDLGPGNQSRPVPGGRIWQSFAWSPLVQVFRPGEGPVDLSTDTGRFGFAHPLLSNNGIYNVLFFEELDRRAGRSAVNRTVVQPVNAAATIGGVADGNYEVTLGYEGVAQLYQEKGADIEVGMPILRGKAVTTPVLFSVGLVKDNPHAGAQEFIATLFEPEVQEGLADYGFYPAMAGAPRPGGLSLEGVRVLHYDWSEWEELEAALPRYEVA